MSEPERYFFCHMQKTAGTSLYSRMKRMFGEAGMYPNDSDGNLPKNGAPVMIPLLLERWRPRREQIRVISAHFPLCVTELLDADFRTFTVLRDPVERTLSYLRHTRAKEEGWGERSLEEIYEEPWWYCHFIENHMVRMLSLRPEEMESFGMLTIIETDRERLETAKRALEGLDTFGLQEEFDAFAHRLEALFGWDLGPPVRENITKHKRVPRSLKKRIAKDNALDIALYEHARELLGRRAPLLRRI